jgi:DNA repair protein RadD
MQLRPRQVDFVESCVNALKTRGNTIGVAPTGAGKTVMLSAVAGSMGGRVLILQHRDELVSQNRATFKAVCPGVETDLYVADRKRWSPGATFAMIQTLSRESNLSSMPPFDMVVIDEAHHVAAKSYLTVVERARQLNPNVKLFGVTATPSRGDGLGLSKVFDNVADVITLGELIQAGFLVRPRTFVIDCNLRESLAGVKKTSVDFDMNEVAEIMDKQAVTSRVIDEWRKVAGDRRTVVFCSTVDHARHVMQAFQGCGYKTDMVYGDMPDGERRSVLRSFDMGDVQVLINVAVLTEGWDCQPVSCVVLLRPCSYKSTMIQMIGRGLRKVDPERYPGIVKSDCIVMDFGYSLHVHGGIETDIAIQDKEGKGVCKCCPDCSMDIPIGSMVCPICGYEYPEEDESDPNELIQKARSPLVDFSMTEVHLLEVSPYKWQDMFDGYVTIANGMSAWACMVLYKDRWHSIGRYGNDRCHLLAVSDDKTQALASADDFLRQYGDKEAARKTKRWLNEPATDKQLTMLGISTPFGVTKYGASCSLTWNWNEREIRRIIQKIS